MVTLTAALGEETIDDAMSEHGFLAAMLAVVGCEIMLLGFVLGYFTYRISRVLERVEGVGAATFLEVRKALGQLR